MIDLVADEDEEEVLDSTEDTGPMLAALPQLFLRAIGKGTHQCRCLDCEPDTKEAIVKEAFEQLYDFEVRALTEAAKEALLVKVKEQVRPEVTKTAREMVLAEEKKRAKSDMYMKRRNEATARMEAIVRAELVASLTPIVTQEIKDTLKKQMDALQNIKD